MTTLSHTLSASVLSLMIAKVNPSQTGLVLTALMVPAALDVDHMVMIFLKRKIFAKEGYRGNLHKARSFMHEMLGVLIVGILALWIGAVNRPMSVIIFFSYLIHVIEDVVMGISFPFTPVTRRECFLFKYSMRQKSVVDVCVIIISLFLWVRYLKG